MMLTSTLKPIYSSICRVTLIPYWSHHMVPRGSQTYLYWTTFPAWSLAPAMLYMMVCTAVFEIWVYSTRNLVYLISRLISHNIGRLSLNEDSYTLPHMILICNTGHQLLILLWVYCEVEQWLSCHGWSLLCLLLNSSYFIPAPCD